MSLHEALTDEELGPTSAVSDMQWPRAGGTPTLALLVNDFAAVLGAELALVCELDRDMGARVLSSSASDHPVAISIPTDGGIRWRGGRLDRRGCFVGRALVHGRPAFETLDPEWDADLIAAGREPASRALAFPIGLFGRAEGRALIAAFSRSPADLERALWIADAYARMIALSRHRAAPLSR